MSRSKYTVLADQPEYLIIQDVGDWNLNSTITNDVENVVSDLSDRLGGRRLFYFDSYGQMDEIIVVDGKFSDFSSGGIDGIKIQKLTDNGG